MGKKIVLIGAGSTQFAKRVIGDILWFPDMQIDEIALVDINAYKLGVMKRVAENLVKVTEKKTVITAATDRCQALPGADFVINTIGVGGAERYRRDLEIADHHGVNYNVGDIIGATAIFRLIREYPHILGMCRDMERLCPDAYFFNYSNPMAPLMTALLEATKIKAYGICHNVQETWEALAQYMNVEPERVTYWCAGINHMDWFLQLKVDGEDAYPRLFEIAKSRASIEEAASRETCYHEDDIDMIDYVRFQIMEEFGFFPSESPYHMSEYCPYYRKNDALIRQWHVWDRWWLDHEMAADTTIEGFEKKLAAGEDFEIKKSAEYVPEIIHALLTGKVFRANLNVSNKPGLIGNLPRECVVEVPCFIDGEGIHAVHVGDLPAQLAGLNSSNSMEQILMAKAVNTRQKRYIYQAVALDPVAGANLTLGQIREMVDELIASNEADGYLDGWTE
ncbi:MAG: alpha-glucosidase/alpha-galactosidase [Oscillospiraceae bacterium]|nr:alpha-glucosidase/alpha-galactosidase [Oscillospiraceae bacterium]MDY5641646.1 alpha-glucosidase/alpha-galactosidase [Candidatus Faecousia sp.]